jgi:hypothetical protein
LEDGNPMPSRSTYAITQKFLWPVYHRSLNLQETTLTQYQFSVILQYLHWLWMLRILSIIGLHVTCGLGSSLDVRVLLLLISQYQTLLQPNTFLFLIISLSNDSWR